MEGRNKLCLCEAEMKKAIQLYIEHLMPNEKVVVSSIRPETINSCPEFVINLEPEQE